jgi:peptidoglycan/LPS O-acetylase OafA/YrhL
MLSFSELLPVGLGLLLALGTLFVLSSAGTLTVAEHRFGSVDGLRGILALLVVFHHAGVWYIFVREGEWRAPPGNFYNQIGQGSVSLFFMITAFLFTRKILDARFSGKPLDWRRLWVARFYRLAPLYLVSILIMGGLVAVLTEVELHESPYTLLRNCMSWLSFTVLGNPDVNGYTDTWQLNAGVAWSLPYEWCFYVCLPLIALLLGTRPPVRFVVLSLLGAAFFLYAMSRAMWVPKLSEAMMFAGGFVAALTMRVRWLARFARTPVAALLVIGLLGCEYTQFSSAFGYAQLLLLSAAFVLLAAGNDVFGLLTSRAARTLGAITYSVYLLHGILLFVVFGLVVGHERARSFTAGEHWALVLLLVPVLLVVSALSYRWIELPAMRFAQLRAGVLPASKLD